MNGKDLCAALSSSESDEEANGPVPSASSHSAFPKFSKLVPLNNVKQNVPKNSVLEHSDLKEIKLSSSLQPGRTFETYLNIYPHLKKDEPKNKLKELSLSKLEEMKSKNKRAQPGFEKQYTLPPYFESRRKRRREGLKERDKTMGSKWFNMPATEVTEEIKNDLTVLQMRASLNPKQFYKRGNDKICPKYFQVGTVIEAPDEFFSARIPKKQRKKTLVDELLGDAEYRKYQKKKYAEAMKNQIQRRFPASQKKKMKQKKSGSEVQKKHKAKKTKH